MDCKWATRLIPAYLDGELTAENEALLTEHLSSCSSCRAEMVALKQTLAAMEACHDVAPAFTLADIKAPMAQRQIWRGWLPGFGWSSFSPRWSTALGAVFAIFVGTVGGIGLHAVDQPSRPPVASRAVSDMLSLGASDDPLTNLVAERPSASSAVPGDNGQEGRQ